MGAALIFEREIAYETVRGVLKKPFYISYYTALEFGSINEVHKLLELTLLYATVTQDFSMC